MANPVIPAKTNRHFLQQFDEAISWMQSIGVDTQSGRVASYRRAAAEWAHLQEGDQRTDKALHLLQDITSAVYEVPQFLEIHAAFKDEGLQNFGGIAAKLKKAMLGPTHLNEEDANSNNARNILFEAVTAANVHLPDFGMRTIFNAPSDTGFEFNKKTVWIECKRLTSEKQIQGRVKKACEQLHATIKKHPSLNQRGLVALDISKLIAMPPPRYVLSSKTEAEIPGRADAMLDEYIDKNGHLWQDIYINKDQRIIGTLIRLTLIAISEDIGKYVFVHIWRIHPRPNLMIDDKRILNKMVQVFQHNQLA